MKISFFSLWRKKSHECLHKIIVFWQFLKKFPLPTPSLFIQTVPLPEGFFIPPPFHNFLSPRPYDFFLVPTYDVVELLFVLCLKVTFHLQTEFRCFWFTAFRTVLSHILEEGKFFSVKINGISFVVFARKSFDLLLSHLRPVKKKKASLKYFMALRPFIYPAFAKKVCLLVKAGSIKGLENMEEPVLDFVSQMQKNIYFPRTTVYRRIYYTLGCWEKKASPKPKNNFASVLFYGCKFHFFSLRSCKRG